MRRIAHLDAADFDPITKHRTGPPGVYLPDQNRSGIIAGSITSRHCGSVLERVEGTTRYRIAETETELEDGRYFRGARTELI